MSNIEINVHDKEKYVSVWLTKAESQEEDMHISLTPLCRHWKERKYRVVVFESGDQNLAEQTKGLLSHAVEVSAKDEQTLA